MIADRGEPHVVIPEGALDEEAMWTMHLAALAVFGRSELRRVLLNGPTYDRFDRYETEVRLLFVNAVLEGKYDELVAEFTKRLLLR